MVSELGFPSQGFVGQKIYFSGIFSKNEKEGQNSMTGISEGGKIFLGGSLQSVRYRGRTAVRTGPYSVRTETEIYRFFKNFKFV